MIFTVGHCHVCCCYLQFGPLQFRGLNWWLCLLTRFFGCFISDIKVVSRLKICVVA